MLTVTATTLSSVILEVSVEIVLNLLPTKAYLGDGVILNQISNLFA